MFREVNGFYVPKDDVKCSEAVFNTKTDADESISLCRGREVVVQAGGNFGVWAKYLSDIFKTVYTFEPDPLNFSALSRNIGDIQNIIKLQSALGERGETPIELHREDNNAGAHYVNGHGYLPCLALDYLHLPACDLIILDIEGYELKALRGAEQTIIEFRPVIHLEEKGLSKKYGVMQGDAALWLSKFGYKIKDMKNRDIILSV